MTTNPQPAAQTPASNPKGNALVQLPFLEKPKETGRHYKSSRDGKRRSLKTGGDTFAARLGSLTYTFMDLSTWASRKKLNGISEAVYFEIQNLYSSLFMRADYEVTLQDCKTFVEKAEENFNKYMLALEQHPLVIANQQYQTFLDKARKDYEPKFVLLKKEIQELEATLPLKPMPSKPRSKDAAVLEVAQLKQAKPNLDFKKLSVHDLETVLAHITITRVPKNCPYTAEEFLARLKLTFILVLGLGVRREDLQDITCDELQKFLTHKEKDHKELRTSVNVYTTRHQYLINWLNSSYVVDLIKFVIKGRPSDGTLWHTKNPAIYANNVLDQYATELSLRKVKLSP